MFLAPQAARDSRVRTGGFPSATSHANTLILALLVVLLAKETALVTAFGTLVIGRDGGLICTFLLALTDFPIPFQSVRQPVLRAGPLSPFAFCTLWPYLALVRARQGLQALCCFPLITGASLGHVALKMQALGFSAA